MDINNYAEIYKPSKTRFYILFSFSFYSFVFGFIWNSWQPIMIPFQQLFNWSLTEINLLINVNTIVFCLFIVPFVLFYNKYGIQRSYYISVSCVMVGSMVRIKPGSIQTQSIMILVGNSVSALGNLISAIGCTGISALWFPSQERARSTTTALSFTYLGSAVAPLVANFMVPDSSNGTNITSYIEADILRRNIEGFMYTHCVLSLVSLLLILFYFPPAPSVMPCKSSEKSLRIDIVSGCKVLLRNKQFWLVFMMNFISAGISSGVFAVLTSIIIPLGISQKDAALIKCLSTLCMFMASLFGGWASDKFGYKVVILWTVPPTMLLSVIFGLQSLNLLWNDFIGLLLVISLLSFVSTIIGPISYEMGCEAAFPVSEEVSTAIICIASNIGTMLFLFLTMIPNIGTDWVLFSYAVCMGFILLIQYFYKGVKKRFECDGLVSDKLFT